MKPARPKHPPEDVSNTVDQIMEYLFTSIQNEEPPDSSLWTLLETLNAAFSPVMEQPAQEVCRLLNRKIPSINLDPADGDVDNICHALESCSLSCPSVWLQLLFSICDILTPKFVNIVKEGGEQESCEGNVLYAENSVKALASLFCKPDFIDCYYDYEYSDEFSSTVMHIIESSLVLVDVMQYQLNSSAPHKGLVSSISAFIVRLVETHYRVVLDSLLLPVEATERKTALRLIQAIILCSNMPGQYPLEENCSIMAFNPIGCWFVLVDEIKCYDEARSKKLVQLLSPVYTELADILLHKSLLPGRDELEKYWSLREYNLFLSYRKDIRNILLCCEAILHESLLQHLSNILQAAYTSFQKDPVSWRKLESTIHGFLSVANEVPDDENKILPKLLVTLKSLPLNEMDVRAVFSVLDTVDAFTEWMRHHPEALSDQLALFMMALDFSKKSLGANRLNADESVCLMQKIGKILMRCPTLDITAYLDDFPFPKVAELQQLAKIPNAHKKINIPQHLQMMRGLISTFLWRRLGNAEAQCLKAILCWFIPVLKSVFELWNSDKDVLRAIVSFLEGMKVSFLNDRKPYFSCVIGFLASAFSLDPQPSLLDTAVMFLEMLPMDTHDKEWEEALLGNFTTIFLQQMKTFPCLPEFFYYIQQFFEMHLDIMMKDVHMAVHMTGKNIFEVFELGMTSLSLENCEVNKNAAACLSFFVLRCGESPQLCHVVKELGKDLTTELLKSLSRSNCGIDIGSIIELLLALKKEFFEDLCRWLPSVLSQENFPTPFPSPEDKHKFQEFFLRETANKESLEKEVKSFALLCQGLEERS